MCSFVSYFLYLMLYWAFFLSLSIIQEHDYNWSSTILLGKLATVHLTCISVKFGLFLLFLPFENNAILNILV